jgi:hypothetical protein
MEERNVNKDWIFDQIKQKGEKVQLKPTMDTVGVLM